MFATIRRLLGQTAAPTALERTIKIARANDEFRRRPYHDPKNRVVFTDGAMSLTGWESTDLLAGVMIAQSNMLAEVAQAFRETTFDIYDERTTGTIEYMGAAVIFRITYHALDFQAPARDPSDTARTARSLTISLPDELDTPR